MDDYSIRSLYSTKIIQKWMRFIKLYRIIQKLMFFNRPFSSIFGIETYLQYCKTEHLFNVEEYMHAKAVSSSGNSGEQSSAEVRLLVYKNKWLMEYRSSCFTGQWKDSKLECSLYKGTVDCATHSDSQSQNYSQCEQYKDNPSTMMHCFHAHECSLHTSEWVKGKR